MCPDGTYGAAVDADGTLREVEPRAGGFYAVRHVVPDMIACAKGLTNGVEKVKAKASEAKAAEPAPAAEAPAEESAEEQA